VYVNYSKSKMGRFLRHGVYIYISHFAVTQRPHFVICNYFNDAHYFALTTFPDGDTINCQDMTDWALSQWVIAWEAGDMGTRSR